jgi:hypothetical protein
MKNTISKARSMPRVTEGGDEELRLFIESGASKAVIATLKSGTADFFEIEQVENGAEGDHRAAMVKYLSVLYGTIFPLEPVSIRFLADCVGYKNRKKDKQYRYGSINDAYRQGDPEVSEHILSVTSNMTTGAVVSEMTRYSRNNAELIFHSTERASCRAIFNAHGVKLLVAIRMKDLPADTEFQKVLTDILSEYYEYTFQPKADLPPMGASA